MFGSDKENENSPAGPSGVMNDFQEALSKRLSAKYIEYFNGLKLKNPKNGEMLEIGADGRSGSGYSYLMEKLNESATKFLGKLDNGELPEKYSVEDYLKGNYSFMAPAPPPEKKDDDVDLMRGHAGPGVALQRMENGHGPEGHGSSDHAPMEPPSLGEMLSRPPKGMEREPFAPPMMEMPGKDKTKWLGWDGQKATVSDLDSYVLNHRRRMKPCTSFDVLGKNSGENKVFGTPHENAVHFNSIIADAISEIKDQFPHEYDTYFEAYDKASGDSELDRRKYLINPLNYIGTDERADQPRYYRIRVGASDADTSLSVSMTLACKLAEAGKDVDYALVWDQPHSEADYAGEVIDWIEKIVK
jgi:hypothetical protein